LVENKKHQFLPNGWMMILAERLRDILHERKLKITTVERQAQLKPGSINNILQGRSRHPRQTTLEALSRVLECDISDLVAENGYSSLRYEGVRHPWDASLAVDCVQVLDDLCRHMGLEPSMEKMFILARELYKYCWQENSSPLKADPRFAKWLLLNKL
jgi:DNA-binding Xre family transcriptional regulator